MAKVKPKTNEVQLVDGKKLLDILFDEDSRPSLRWLRAQREQGTIPFVKIGRFVRFDPFEARKALMKKGKESE